MSADRPYYFVCFKFQVDCLNMLKLILYNFSHDFPHVSLNEQSWPCHKIGQGQPMVIIYINFVGPESQMLCAKFEGHQSTGYGEDF